MTIRLQRYIAILSVILFLGKIWAWYITHSVIILTDALESIVNVIAGFIGLYSVILAAKPRDLNHPYGHGKVEFVSAAIEGSLITFAGIAIIYEAVHLLLNPEPIRKLDVGIYITGTAGLINYLVGIYAVKLGKQNRSLTVEAAGNHLNTDAYSTLAMVIGFLLLLFTGWSWLDSVVAIIFALIIIITGYRLVRRSMAGIMDEADERMLAQVIEVLQKNRQPQWIDLHNLRVIQYGDIMHIDAHMTLPWYYEVRQAEQEIHALEKLIQDNFGGKVEMFIHIDACMPYSCKLCALSECNVRQAPFQHQIVWTPANVRVDSKHGKE